MRSFFLILALFGQGMISGLYSQENEAGIGDSLNTFMISDNLDYFLNFGCIVVEKGQDPYVFTHGPQTNEHLRDFTDSSIFNLGSVSKLFTAMSVVKLADMGAIRLDDPVYFYFPEFLNIGGKSKHAHKVRIIDLLQHHGGIEQSMEHLYPELFGKDAFDSEDQYYENTYNYRAFISKEDFIQRFQEYARLKKKPGRKYMYSNLGFVILGYIVESVTERNLAEFVTNEFFVPLRMEDSHYYQTPDSMLDRLCRGYYRLSDGSYLNVHENEVESPSPTGDGGIKTSLRDMKRFMYFLVGEFEKLDLSIEQAQAILPRSELLSMMTPLKKGPDKDTWVGLGFHNLQPFNFTGHAGGHDGFLNILYYHPDSHSCVFLTTNREDNELFLFLQVYSAYALLHRKF